MEQTLCIDYLFYRFKSNASDLIVSRHNIISVSSRVIVLLKLNIVCFRCISGIYMYLLLVIHVIRGAFSTFIIQDFVLGVLTLVLGDDFLHDADDGHVVEGV